MSGEQVETFPTPHKFDDQALFDQAEADEATDTPVAEEAEVEQEQPEPVTAEADTAEKPAVDDNAPQVPSWRVREINEEKRQLAAENERIKAELAQARALSSQQQPKEQQPEKPSKVDPLLDPDGYAKQVREEIRNELLAERREESLQNAAEKYGDEFKAAYAAAQQNIDPGLRARMQAARNPGETLIAWHRENQQRAEIGNDLTAYKQRLREEALKDPEFRKAAMAAWQEEAQQNTNGSPKVVLPPSLRNVNRSTNHASTVGDDLSNEGLWEHANS